MNKDNAKDYLPLVQALADGKVIQFNDGSRWRDLGSGHISWDYSANCYRIKPEPREIFVVIDDDHKSHLAFHSWDDAINYAEKRGYEVRRYREVIE